MSEALFLALSAGLLALGHKANGASIVPSGQTQQGARNLAAFLHMIRAAEGTADEGGWSRLFGGGSFVIGNDHPRIVVNKSGYKSSAAGAFQIIQTTWDNVQRFLHLPDFSPASQTAAAVFLLRDAGAYDDVLAGNFASAVKKSARVWASLPGSPYGQPIRSAQFIAQAYTSAGGQVA